MSFFPPTVQNWHHTIKVGDYVAKKIEENFWVYQEVTAMTRSKKVTRQVRGFSSICPRGELGDTYLGSMDTLIDPQLWVLLKNLGWPSLYSLSNPFTVFCDMVERNGVLCPIILVKNS